MTRSLSKGTVLKGANTGKTIVVGELLGDGANSNVYKVDYDGEPKALKWYSHPGDVSEELRFMLKQPPKWSNEPEFLWPIELVECATSTPEKEGENREPTANGYVMDLIPQGYYLFSDYLLTCQHFSSLLTLIDACSAIALAFKKLHAEGYCFQSVCNDDLFLDSKTGEVLICNFEDIIPSGAKTTMYGSPRYMAPELMIDYWERRSGSGPRQIYPSHLTDRHSMAVFIFEAMMLAHPLEGKRTLVPVITEKFEAHLYGYNALFMFDPDDKSNAPNDILHAATIKRWNAIPSHMREVFQKAFSQAALKNQNMRVTEEEWLEALSRFRSIVSSCQ